MAYTYAQLEGYWINAGGPANVAPIAAAIALAESSGDNVIQQGEPYSTTGWGLWQITPGNSEPTIGVDNALLDPSVNAKAAVAKYQAAGDSFAPWTTYTSGRYVGELQQGVAPDLSAASTPATLTSGIPNPLNLIPGLGGASGVLSAGSTFAGLLAKLLDPSWWKRVGKMAIAILLGVVAITFLFSKSTTGTEVKGKVSEGASMAAMAA